MSDGIERFEDMSPLGRLRLYRQDDGDVIVQVVPDPTEPQHYAPSVEFCARAGGGQSPKTLAALYALMEAMEEDNRERKQGRKQ